MLQEPEQGAQTDGSWAQGRSGTEAAFDELGGGLCWTLRGSWTSELQHMTLICAFGILQIHRNQGVQGYLKGKIVEAHERNLLIPNPFTPRGKQRSLPSAHTHTYTVPFLRNSLSSKGI